MKNSYVTYNGSDLGAQYTKELTKFKLWAPTASKVNICFYASSTCLGAESIANMIKSENGTWYYERKGDLSGMYYTYLVCHDGKYLETVDPYAYAVGVNGVRTMILDMSTTDPEGFDKDKGPVYKNKTDIVVTEVSVADATADESCNAKYPGKYLGLTEKGLTTLQGIPTGLDHIVDMGVTHVQIMPAYDFASIDESDLDKEQYNWGYDPLNYNVPEGSYATDPFNGEVRIKEFKKMVQSFHNENIGVIMDVVYNHTYDVEGSCFQRTVPDYFYRKDGDRYSNASACGNEIASDRPMVRKYIIDSLCHWVKEYHIDGFRFDLMGVLDIETMNEITRELKKLNPDIILYGEGWAGGDSTLSEELRALKVNVGKLDGFGVFSDDMRDGIKGHVFNLEKKGFVNGGVHMENDIRYCVTGSMEHPQVDYEKYTYTKGGPWAKEPEDVVNYVSCHDNLTLWDKLVFTCPECSKEELMKMNLLSAAIVFTSQGIPFFLEGEEFGRTKPIEGSNETSENSYNLPLYTNSLKYDQIAEFKDMYEYYKGLIQFRKNHAGLRMNTAKQVKEEIKFIDVLEDNVVSFEITQEKETLFVVYNANKESISIKLPDSNEWKVMINNKNAGNTVLETIKNQTEIQGISCLVAVRSN